MAKAGPRARRIAKREALASIEQSCDKYVRDRLRSQLVVNAKAAVAGFKKERGR